MIEVQALSRRYGDVLAVDRISFTVERGEIVGLLGPNGAGKTTTLRMITGYLYPTEGTVRIAGISLAEDPLAAKRRMGYLPEDNPLYTDLTPREYLTFRMQVYEVDDPQALPRVAETTGIVDVLDRPIAHLSKGYRQRVGLAAALLHDPDILILDEPTTGLDPLQILEIRGLIQRLAEEKTILFSTHILPEVQALARRVIIIHRGRIVAEGDPQTLAEQARGARIHVLVRGEGVEEALKQFALGEDLQVEHTEEGVRFSFVPTRTEPDPREGVFRWAVEHNLTLLELHRETFTLEEVFVRLTKEEVAS